MNERLYFPYRSDNNDHRILIKDINEIYTRLSDAPSQDIFSNRLMFSITSDFRYIRNIMEGEGVNETGQSSDVYKKEIWLYGAGVRGRRIPLLYPEYNWIGYIDVNREGERYNDLPVVGLKECELIRKNDNTILLTNLVGYEEIYENLIQLGFKKDRIVILEELYQYAAKRMYFDTECVEKERCRNKIFVDAGCFDGNDTKRFYKWLGDIPARSISFELDKHNYNICKRNLEPYIHAEVYNMGLAQRSGKLKIKMGKGVETSFSQSGDIEAIAISLDEFVKTEEIGYIKMDIEGAEKDALYGAKEVIRTQKPMLAVSLYHKREDIWEIPKLILSINPDYKFYLRHYSLSIAETVLYAV